MSTSIGQYGNTGASIILSAGIKQMTLEQQTLSWETAGRTLSETYAGLGASRSTVIALAPRITQITAWQGNISTAQGNLTLTANALTNIVTQAQALSTNLLSILGTTQASTVTSIATEARNALTQLGNTLNTSNGTGYIFAGQEASEPPIPGGASSLATSSLSTQIASLVSSMGTGTLSASDVMEQATTAANPTSSFSVFSSALSTTPVAAGALASTVITGNGTSSIMGIVATQSSTSSAASATSTGSPIMDLMRDMMVVSSMSGLSSTSPGYTDLVTQLNTSLKTTVSQLVEMESTVGTAQDGLTSNASLLTNVQTMLKTQVTNIQGADIAQVATETSALSTNLEASYQLIAKMKSMTLASYI